MKEKVKRVEPVTELTLKMEVEEIIKKGLQETRDELDRYFIRKNRETTGHYGPLLSKVANMSTKLIETILSLVKL